MERAFAICSRDCRGFFRIGGLPDNVDFVEDVGCDVDEDTGPAGGSSVDGFGASTGTMVFRVSR